MSKLRAASTAGFAEGTVRPFPFRLRAGLFDAGHRNTLYEERPTVSAGRTRPVAVRRYPSRPPRDDDFLNLLEACSPAVSSCLQLYLNRCLQLKTNVSTSFFQRFSSST